MAEVQNRRLFIGGLFDGVTEKEIKERFDRFGTVTGVEIIKRTDDQGELLKTFAYVNTDISEAKLKACVSAYGKAKWKGCEIKIQVAKESFLTRLERERKSSVPEEKKELDAGSPSQDQFQVSGYVPGTPIPGKRNWVVGKFGRVLPVMFIRRRDGKKVSKFDPSKTTHCLKRLKEDSEKDKSVSDLTWDLEKNASETESKKRRKTNMDEAMNRTVKDGKKEHNYKRALDNEENGIDESHDVMHNPKKSVESSVNTKRQNGNGLCKGDDVSELSSEEKSHENAVVIRKDGNKKRKTEDVDNVNTESDMLDSKVRKPNIPTDGDDGVNENMMKTDENSNVSIGKRDAKAKDTKHVQFLNDDIASNDIEEEEEERDEEKYYSSEDSVDQEDDDITDIIKMMRKEAEEKRKIISTNGSVSEDKRTGEKRMKGDVETEDTAGSTGDESSGDSDEEIDSDSFEDSGSDSDTTDDENEDDGSDADKPRGDMKRSKRTETGYDMLGSFKGEDSIVEENKSDYSKEEERVDSDDDCDKVENEEEVERNGSKSEEETDESESECSSDDESKSDGSKHIEESSVSKGDSKKGIKEEKRKGIEEVNGSDDTEGSSDEDDGSDGTDNAVERTSGGKDNKQANSEIGVQHEKKRKSQQVIEESSDSSSSEDSTSSEEEEEGEEESGKEETKIKVDDPVNVKGKEKPEKKKTQKDERLEKEKHALSNEKRIKSLADTKERNDKQKEIIKNALHNMDSKDQKKHIVFEDSEDEDNKTAEKKIGGSKAASWLGLDSSDDDSEADVEDGEDEEIKIKSQFEGKAGEKLFNLQKKIGIDERFKLDERFMESDEDEDREEEQTLQDGEINADDELTQQINKEKNASLSILQKVLGNCTTVTTQEIQAPVFKDPVHYDPSREDHKEFEQKVEKSKTKVVPVTPQQSKAVVESVAPEVSSDRFYNVSSSLTDLLGGTKDTGSTFTFFGGEPVQEEDEDGDGSDADNEETDRFLIKPWVRKALGFESSDEEGDNIDDQEMEEKQEELQPASKKTFFFRMDDEAVKSKLREASSSFMRQGSLEDITEHWKSVRVELTQNYKKKHKDSVRKVRKMKEKKR